MNELAIFYPVFMLVLLVFALGFRMGVMRYRAVSENPSLGRFYVNYRGDEEPENIRIISRNFINQFEVPVLFYCGVIMAYVVGQVSTLLVGLAWLFVALRYLHTVIHLGRNVVLYRFQVFVLSCLVLGAFWLILAVAIFRAG